MPEMIRDGAGKGNLAKVNDNQRLYTSSISVPENYQATKLGNSYNINTGLITLTNAAETPLIYVKNNEDVDLHILTIVIGTFASTNGTGQDGVPKAVFIKNPKTGTIITSTPTDVDIISNRNYGSSKTLTIDAYKGATGDTMTDGTDHIIVQMGTSGRTVVPIDEVLQKGSSFGLKYTPQGSNDDQQVYVALICHLEDASE
jgi:hypothetical protein